MEQYPTIYLMQGATSIVDIDLTDFEMQGGYVLMVMRERGGDVLREWRFDASEAHSVVFEDEFTATLDAGGHMYEYDIMWHVDGERFAQCAPSRIEVSKTVGGYPYDAED